MTLHLDYICVCIDMFVHLITVSLFYVCVCYTILLLVILHLGILFYISTMHGLFHHCIIVTCVFILICLWMLYLWLLQYVWVPHNICSLVALHIGNRAIYISCILFFIQLSSFSLICIHRSVLKSCCLNYLSPALKHVSLFLITQYLIYLSLLKSFSVVSHYY